MSVVLLSYLAFGVLALPDGLAGVSWPSVSRSVGVPVDYLSLVLPFAVAASTLSSTAAGFVLGRIGLGRLLAGSTGLSAAALAAYGLATSFWMVPTATVLLAAGSGAIDAGLNAHAARTFTARRITWMHAGYGLGAMAGPLLVTAATDGGFSWRGAYLLIAALQAVFSAVFAVTAGVWSLGAGPASPGPDGHERMPALRLTEAVRDAGVRRGAALFFLQNGVESSTALWAYVFLTEGRGLSHGFAAAAVSGYWIAQSAGRFAVGPVADRIGPYRILAAGASGFVLGAVLLTVPAAPSTAAAGVVLIGAAASPMSPLLMLTTKERTGPLLADRAVGLQAGASTLGAAVFPALIGPLIGRCGAGVFAPAMVVVTVAAGVLQCGLLSRRHAGGTTDVTPGRSRSGRSVRRRR